MPTRARVSAICFALAACGSGPVVVPSTPIMIHAQIRIGEAELAGRGPWTRAFALRSPVTIATMSAITSSGCKLIVEDVTSLRAHAWAPLYRSRMTEARLADDDLTVTQIKIKVADDAGCTRGDTPVRVSYMSTPSPWRRLGLLQVPNGGSITRRYEHLGARLRLQGVNECGSIRLRFLDATDRVVGVAADQRDTVDVPRGTTIAEVTAESRTCHPFDPAGPSSVAPSYSYWLQVSSAP